MKIGDIVSIITYTCTWQDGPDWDSQDFTIENIGAEVVFLSKGTTQAQCPIDKLEYNQDSECYEVDSLDCTFTYEANTPFPDVYAELASLYGEGE